MDEEYHKMRKECLAYYNGLTPEGKIDAEKLLIELLMKNIAAPLDPALVEKARAEQKELGEWLGRTLGDG